MLFAIAFHLSGCAYRTTPPPAPGEITQEFLDLAQPLASAFASGMLAANPKYADVVCGVADGMGLALQQSELTPEMVDRFTQSLRADHPELDPVHYAMVRSFIIGTYDIWRRRYGPIDPQSAQAKAVIEDLDKVLRQACDTVRPPAG